MFSEDFLKIEKLNKLFNGHLCGLFRIVISVIATAVSCSRKWKEIKFWIHFLVSATEQKKILLLQDIWLPLADSCSLQGSIHYAKGPFRLELGKPWFLRGHNFLFDTKASLGAISRQIPESVSKLSCCQKSLYLYCAHMYQLNAPPPQQQHFEPVRCPEGVKL